MNRQPNLEQQMLSERYRVAPEAFWQLSLRRGDDGYERMELARGHGWRAVPSWGLDGWDLGGWPLVVIFHRRTAEGFEVAYDVEGDIRVYRYPTRELRGAATDCLAFCHWKHNDEDWVDGVERVDTAPDRLRGPFSWERLDASKRAFL